MRKTKRKKHTKTITKIVLFSGILIGGGIGIVTIMNRNVPEKRLMEYMKYIEKGEYEQMYAMLDCPSIPGTKRVTASAILGKAE